ncbi:hypothetical protein I7I48_10475 [Histoplasma ohiense]|nr:hypothetical protein I7I48_10475 [Histoplasma ohiense (nom. inval.)]
MRNPVLFVSAGKTLKRGCILWFYHKKRSHTSAVIRLLVQSTTTFGLCLSRSSAVRSAFTARIASKGSFPCTLCSRLAVSVSASSMNTHTKVSGSSSRIFSMLSNIRATSLPLSLKNLLPSECALISTILLWGNCLPRRIDSFCANPRLKFKLVSFYNEKLGYIGNRAIRTKDSSFQSLVDHRAE